MRAAIYARVSSVGNGQSVEPQLADLRQLAERRGFQIVQEYCDEGWSGAKDDRPALNTMLADARRGRFKILLVWRLDRLGRSLAHLVRLLEDFRSLGVELVSYSEGLDFTTSHGKLLYSLLSAFAEFERECIRERVRAGLRHARAQGKKLGRPRVSVDTARIQSLRAQGRGWKAISRELGVGVSTVLRAAQEASWGWKKGCLAPD